MLLNLHQEIDIITFLIALRVRTYIHGSAANRPSEVTNQARHSLLVWNLAFHLSPSFTPSYCDHQLSLHRDVFFIRYIRYIRVDRRAQTDSV